VAGTKNATLPGVLHLDCLRDENTAPPYPGLVRTDQPPPGGVLKKVLY